MHIKIIKLLGPKQDRESLALYPFLIIRRLWWMHCSVELVGFLDASLEDGVKRAPAQLAGRGLLGPDRMVGSDRMVGPDRLVGQAEVHLARFAGLDDEAHLRFTGRSNRRVHATLRALVGAGFPDLLPRVPLVPGITDTRENLEAGKLLTSKDYFDCFSCHQRGAQKPQGPPEGWAPDLALAHARRPEVPFIFISGVMGEERAIESMKNGATDYVLKERIDRLLPSERGRLVPSRQVVVYFRQPEEARAAWSKGPMIIDKTGEVGLYLVPPMQGRGMKVGDHEFSRRGDPDMAREADAGEMAPLLARCRQLLRGFDAWQIDRLKVCFYTVTEDERFVVEKHGAKGWVMSPCSGHGFKFGALMGRELARTIIGVRDAEAHARWAAGLEAQAPT